MRRPVLAALLALVAAPALAQGDGGAFYNEQVRRNQQFGVPGQPPPVAYPPVGGPAAFDHDAVRARQAGALGPALPTAATPGPRVLDPGQRVVTPAAPPPLLGGRSTALRGTARVRSRQAGGPARAYPGTRPVVVRGE